MGLNVRLADGTLIDMEKVLFIRPANSLEEKGTYFAVFDLTSRKIQKEDYEYLSRLPKTPKELWESRFNKDAKERSTRGF